MSLLTIGAFAKLSRLSPKALRLYDDLGLLPPARVDPASGYRLYHPDQLDQARLVAWLRRLGMPLARIRQLSRLAPAAAAAEVAAYWAECEAEAATRRDLATFLIGYLSGQPVAPARPPSQPALGLRYAAASDTGRQRQRNQDAAYAGDRLLAVADGFGTTGGELASAAVIDALRPLSDGTTAGDLLNALEQAVDQANEAVAGLVGAGPECGPGTTLTAMLLAGRQLALVHIGDSRAYLLRAGELFQITHDHTYVQSLVDAGRLTRAEAASHPQRSLLLRALDGTPGLRPDLSLHDARPGDRYLLCSDGLSTVAPEPAIERVLAGPGSPGAAVRVLIGLANDAGGPDNVACVVADVLELGLAEPA